MSLPEQVKLAIRALVADLAAKDYRGVRGRVATVDLDRAISEYGRCLLPLPADDDALFDVIAIDGTTDEWAVEVDMWTKEEGHSDLTLSLTARVRKGVVELEVDDLHVL